MYLDVSAAGSSYGTRARGHRRWPLPSPLRHDVDRLRGVGAARAIGVIQIIEAVGAGGLGQRGGEERGDDREAQG